MGDTDEHILTTTESVIFTRMEARCKHGVIAVLERLMAEETDS